MRGGWTMVAVFAGCVEPVGSPVARADAGVRCVATGVPDPRAITLSIEPDGGENCSEVPGILLDGGAPALFVGGPDPRQPVPQSIGALRCQGYAPGAEVTLSVTLALRVANAGSARPERCRCNGFPSQVLVSASVNGASAMALRLEPQSSSDSTCRDGPWHRGTYPVRADARGEVLVTLSLDHCGIEDEPARCLFVRGTRVSLAPPGGPDAGG